jgi:hypothetical protein
LVDLNLVYPYNGYILKQQHKETIMYTVEIYKADRRVKSGERLVLKSDQDTNNSAMLESIVKNVWPMDKGYRYEIHETYVTRRNVMTGQEFKERYDTPYYCSPSSETFWCQ